MQWVLREELRSLPFPPADEELIRRLTAGEKVQSSKFKVQSEK
jgi:hypothetical protein